MALSTSSSAVAAVSSVCLQRKVSSFPPNLAASASLTSPLLPRGLPAGRLVLSTSSRRVYSTRVQAMKQSFSSFDELLANSNKPVLVDFYATWCGPCQFMGPILNEVGAALKDTIQVVKIDTEKYPSIANQFNIEALPTFIIFRNGKPCDRFEGALPADQLIQRIQRALKDS